MKFTITIIAFSLLALTYKNDKTQHNALSFFPDSKSDLVKEGFKLKSGAVNEEYKKEYGDTIVYFHYPTEESKYHKLIQLNWLKIDTIYFLNFVKQNQSAAGSNTIILADKNGNMRPHLVTITKRYATIIYIHPEFKKYQDRINIFDKAPQTIEN
jgi:hypothetical protein